MKEFQEKVRHDALRHAPVSYSVAAAAAVLLAVSPRHASPRQCSCLSAVVSVPSDLPCLSVCLSLPAPVYHGLLPPTDRLAD